MTPEEVNSESGSQRIPDTYPASQNESSQLMAWVKNNNKPPWGYLHPTNPEFPYLEMTKDEYIIGRSPNCDVVLGQELNSERNYTSTMSKEHFRIRRVVPIAANGDYEDFAIIYIDDLSSNGTFVNGQKIGTGETTILGTSDEISLAFSYFKVFVYESCTPDADVRYYPMEVRNTYAFDRKLGSGACGEVKLVVEKSTGKSLAMKVIEKKRFINDAVPTKSAEVERTQREVEILKALENPYIIHFENFFNSPERLFIITEYVKGGELLDRVRHGPLPEPEAQLLFLQLAMAVKYLHGKGIMHRDVKLENILLSSKTSDSLIKLSDFGLSKFLDSEVILMTFCGSPLYMAPEVLKSRGRRGSYDKQADIWSMGVVLYTCLSGVSPFNTDCEKISLTQQILNGRYSFPSRYWGNVSGKARNLVKRAMTVNSRKRITIDQILEHPWLQARTLKMRLNRLLKAPSLPKTIEEDQKENEENSHGTAKRLKLDEEQPTCSRYVS